MCVRALCVLCACALLATVTAAPGPGSAELSIDGLEPRLSSLYSLLSRHGVLDGGHALARKSVRSPSRRLRFGRRSDPAMPPRLPLEESAAWSDELVRLARAPLRLRFGRSDGRGDGELLVPHVFPEDLAEEEIERSLRSPAMRLRFGRSDTHGPQSRPNLPNDENNGSQD